MLIEVEVQAVHGQVQFVPMNEAARTVAAMLGHTALSPRDLNMASERLDAEVVLIAGKCPAAAEALSEFMHPVTVH